MKRLTTVPVDGVVEALRRGDTFFIVNRKKRVPIGNARMKTYINGTKCVHCGMEAHYFAVEMATNSTRYLLHPYHRTEKGSEIPITSDHIVAKYNGGSNDPKNRQPMCKPCNNLKSHYETIDEAKNVKRMRDANKNSPKTIMMKVNKCV